VAGISLNTLELRLRLAFGSEVSVARMLNQNGPGVSFSTIDISNVARFAAGRVGGVGIRSFVSMHYVSAAITGK
jgi:hypothetical protein